MIAVQVTLVLDCHPHEVADAVNETLREHQRDFNPESCILDYAIGTATRLHGQADQYLEGSAFERVA